MFIASRQPRQSNPTPARVSRMMEGLENRLLFAAGDVDTTFGAAGLAAATFPGRSGIGGDVAVDAPRGRILVVGTLGASTPGSRMAIAAFKLNGQPDTSFSGDGQLITDLAGGGRIDVLPDGRFYIGGQNAAGAPVIERLNRDGSYDRSFSGDGKLTIPASGAYGIGADGKIVHVSGRNGPFTVTRYKANGSLDATLGGDGSVTLSYDGGLPIEEGGREWTDVIAVAVQGDGKIIIAADVFGPDQWDGAVVRLKTNGSYDTSFSGDGKQIVATGSVDDFTTAMALAPGGDILVGVIESEAHAFVKRLAPNGAERSFADPGIVGEDPSIYDISVAPDGKVVVSGNGDWFDDEHPNNWFLYRLNAGGGRDTSFGGTGSTHVVYPVGYRQAVDPSGNILVVNTFGSRVPGAPVFGVTRYRGSGGGDTGEGMKLVNGTLSVAGTSRGDQIDVDRAFEGVIVTKNGLARTFPFADVQKISIAAGAGNDHVSVGGLLLPITVDAGSGDDHIVTSYGNDRLIGGSGNDFLSGGPGNDTLDGGDGNDRLEGNDGNDTLTGGAGKDQLRGNAGKDTLYASGDGSADFLDGGSGTDRARKDSNDFAQYVEQILA